MNNFRFTILIVISAIIFPLLFIGTDLLSSNKIFGHGGDAYWYLWVFKTFKSSIDSGIFWPQHITSVFYPIGFDLSAGYESVLIYYSSVIFQQFTNVTQTYNLLIYTGYILNILGGYYLIKQVTKQQLIALTFGLALAFAPQVIGRTNGHLPLIWIWPILFYLGFFIQFIKNPKITLAIPLGIFASLSLLVSWYFLTYLIIFSAIIFTHTLTKDRKTLKTRFFQLVLKLIPAALIASGLILLFAWPMFISRIVPNSFYGYPFDMGLGNLVLIKEYNLALLEPFSISGISNLSQYSLLPPSGGETMSFVGLYAIFLVIILVVGKKIKKTSKNLVWLALGIIFYLFALGIYLRIIPGGSIIEEAKIRLPLYWLLFKIPILNTMHAPGRFWMPAQISLIVFFSLIPAYFNKKSKMLILSICFLLIAYESSSYTFIYSELPTQPVEKLDNTAGIFPLKVQDPESLKIAVYYSENVLSGYQTHTTFSSDEDLVIWNSIFQPLVDPNANLWKVLPDLEQPLSPQETIFMAYNLYKLDGYYFRNEDTTENVTKLRQYLKTLSSTTQREGYEYYSIKKENLIQPKKLVTVLESGFYSPEKDGSGKYRESRGIGKISIFNPGNPKILKNNLKISNGNNTRTSLNDTNLTTNKDSIIEIKSGFNEIIIQTDGCEPAGEIKCRGFRVEKYDSQKTIFY